MPRYRITFDDGSSLEQEAANSDQAKQAAKRQAQNKTGATSRTDARVKVASVVDLDVEPGATDPRNRATSGARGDASGASNTAPYADRYDERGDRIDLSQSGRRDAGDAMRGSSSADQSSRNARAAASDNTVGSASGASSALSGSEREELERLRRESVDHARREGGR